MVQWTVKNTFIELAKEDLEARAKRGSSSRRASSSDNVKHMEDRPEILPFLKDIQSPSGDDNSGAQTRNSSPEPAPELPPGHIEEDAGRSQPHVGKPLSGPGRLASSSAPGARKREEKTVDSGTFVFKAVREPDAEAATSGGKSASAASPSSSPCSSSVQDVVFAQEVRKGLELVDIGHRKSSLGQPLSQTTTETGEDRSVSRKNESPSESDTEWTQALSSNEDGANSRRWEPPSETEIEMDLEWSRKRALEKAATTRPSLDDDILDDDASDWHSCAGMTSTKSALNTMRGSISLWSTNSNGEWHCSDAAIEHLCTPSALDESAGRLRSDAPEWFPTTSFEAPSGGMSLTASSGRAHRRGRMVVAGGALPEECAYGVPRGKGAPYRRKHLQLRCHLHINPKMLHPNFDVCQKIIGKGGLNTAEIYYKTGAKIRLLGQGSGTTRRNGREAPMPLLLAVVCAGEHWSCFCEAIRLSAALLAKVSASFEHFAASTRKPNCSIPAVPADENGDLDQPFWVGDLKTPDDRWEEAVELLEGIQVPCLSWPTTKNPHCASASE